MTSLIAYALDFTSFLLEKLGKESEKISKVVLFGSVARGEASEKSDVDIFVDLISDEKNIRRMIEKSVNNFYTSIKFKKYWRLLGIENEINCIPGKLEKWKDVRRSIITDGIILYGKYKEHVKEGKLYCILSWKSIKPESKRAVFNKKMFGYSQRGKKYTGLVQRYSGEKMDNAVIVPLEHANDIIKMFRKMKITVKIKNMSEF